MEKETMIPYKIVEGLMQTLWNLVIRKPVAAFDMYSFACKANR